MPKEIRRERFIGEIPNDTGGMNCYYHRESNEYAEALSRFHKTLMDPTLPNEEEEGLVLDEEGLNLLEEINKRDLRVKELNILMRALINKIL